MSETAAAPAVTPATEDIDYVALLTEPEPGAVATPTETPATEGEGGGEGAATPEPTKPAETPAADATALQAMQQQLTTAQEQIAALTTKLAGGAALTATEKQQQTAAVRSIDKIREALKGEEFDVFDNGKTLASILVEIDDRNVALENEVKGLKGQLATQTQTQQEQASWDAARKAYPGVDVDAVWQKSLDDAAKIIGDDDPNKLARLASSYFHERSSNTLKSITAKGTTADKKPIKATPAVTPGGATTTATVPGSVVTPPALTEDELYDRAVEALIEKD